MKPTSIIFIILSAILIIVGVVLCVVGGSMAKESDALFCDRVDSDGNDINLQSLSKYELTEIDISVEGIDVNIIGQSPESYIEFKNVNSVTYDFTVNKGKLTVKTVNPFDVSSMIKLRENEGGFDGLRHYLKLGKYKDKTAELNIYITPTQTIDSVSVKAENGDVTVKDMTGKVDYTLSATKGNVVFTDSKTDEELLVSTDTGNFTFNMSKAGSIEFSVKDGNGKILADEQYHYTCSCELGEIYVNGKPKGQSYVGAFPQKEGEKVPATVKGEVSSGDITIDKAA